MRDTRSNQFEMEGEKMNRRAFLELSALAVAGCRMCPCGGCKRKLSMNASTLRGYKLPLKEQVAAVAAAGYGGFEPWLKDIHAVMNRHGIGRALWNYKEKDFGFVGESFASIREQFIEVL